MLGVRKQQVHERAPRTGFWEEHSAAGFCIGMIVPWILIPARVQHEDLPCRRIHITHRSFGGSRWCRPRIFAKDVDAGGTRNRHLLARQGLLEVERGDVAVTPMNEGKNATSKRPSGDQQPTCSSSTNTGTGFTQD